MKKYDYFNYNFLRNSFMNVILKYLYNFIKNLNPNDVYKNFEIDKFSKLRNKLYHSKKNGFYVCGDAIVFEIH